jgi:hypothetical protein
MSSEVDLCASILTFYRSDKAELVPPLQGADRSLAGVDGIGQGRHGPVRVAPQRCSAWRLSRGTYVPRIELYIGLLTDPKSRVRVHAPG